MQRIIDEKVMAVVLFLDHHLRKNGVFEGGLRFFGPPPSLARNISSQNSKWWTGRRERVGFGLRRGELGMFIEGLGRICPAEGGFEWIEGEKTAICPAIGGFGWIEDGFRLICPARRGF